jgi:hypothetical protein
LAAPSQDSISQDATEQTVGFVAAMLPEWQLSGAYTVDRMNAMIQQFARGRGYTAKVSGTRGDVELSFPWNPNLGASQAALKHGVRIRFNLLDTLRQAAHYEGVIDAKWSKAPDSTEFILDNDVKVEVYRPIVLTSVQGAGGITVK